MRVITSIKFFTLPQSLPPVVSLCFGFAQHHEPVEWSNHKERQVFSSVLGAVATNGLFEEVCLKSHDLFGRARHTPLG